MRTLLYILGIVSIVTSLNAQKKNINAAWRALTDYQSTLNDKPNLSYLLKAKENIDLAYQNPETKEDSRTLTYYSQIYFELFKYYQNQPDPSVPHYSYLKNAIESFMLLKEKHPKVAATNEVQTLGINLLNTTNQEAIKLFNDKKYLDASHFFEQHYWLQNKIFNIKDTAGIFNAFLSAYKSNDEEKILKTSRELIQNNIDNIKVYQLMYNFYQHKKDTIAALNILKKGREKYPNDITLLNQETEYYISSKQYLSAIKNLELLLQKDSTNALLLLTLGNIYDNLANQNMAAKNYSDSTDNLFQKAIQNYLKSYSNKSQLDAENLFTLTYNIGAYYTNYGLFYYNKKMKEFKITDLSQKQKGVEDKRKEYTQMGLPYLKEAESLKPNDSSVIAALYKVYALIGDTKNADIYKNKMLGK
ncbi:MAG: hypothetical protein KatS3mg027_0495 [Bacteroidia bacterium]|nr:MAG: hypothetical protein KatS3mg027_0495 [Bacteroidia bacterium]